MVSIRSVLWILGISIANILPVQTARALSPPSHLPAAPADKSRLIVLTDIGTEADDQESMVRLLVYANDFDIEGLVATTSTHMRDITHPELIEERVHAYGQALPNLRVHAAGYPSAESLMKRIRTGLPVYGMAGVGKGMDSGASRLIIATVDRDDPRPVWVAIWGGAKDLAQALWTVRATRSQAQVEKFVSKLRVYSISDQDDAGPWARANFPRLFWITSVHAFTQYDLSTWIGISSSIAGADQSEVSRQWLDANIRTKGPLGALYPRPMYIMEGDTPSFLYLIPNGLGSPEHPDWGSWGGRYGQLASSVGLWADTEDSVKGIDGKSYTDRRATVWRWRTAFQNDFLARMNWSVTPAFAGANHPPQVRLNGTGGEGPVEIAACPHQPVKLTAAGSSDPDGGQTLTYRWWVYREPGGQISPRATLAATDGPETSVTVGSAPDLPKIASLPSYSIHVILEVADNGSPSLTSYRRAVITIPGPRSATAGRCLSGAH